MLLNEPFTLLFVLSVLIQALLSSLLVLLPQPFGYGGIFCVFQQMIGFLQM